jgi:hypothetical protein
VRTAAIRASSGRVKACARFPIGATLDDVGPLLVDAAVAAGTGFCWTGSVLTCGRS